MNAEARGNDGDFLLDVLGLSGVEEPKVKRFSIDVKAMALKVCPTIDNFLAHSRAFKDRFNASFFSKITPAFFH